MMCFNGTFLRHDSVLIANANFYASFVRVCASLCECERVRTATNAKRSKLANAQKMRARPFPGFIAFNMYGHCSCNLLEFKTGTLFLLLVLILLLLGIVTCHMGTCYALTFVVQFTVVFNSKPCPKILIRIKFIRYFVNNVTFLILIM